MNNILIKSARQSVRFGLLCLLALSFGLPAARAGLTFDLRLIRDQQGQSYIFYVEFYTNSTPPAAALGTYQINSPQQPTNGSSRKLELTSTGMNFIDGWSSSYSAFNSVMDQITNGNWTIVFTNATTTNYFQFAVSAPDITSNMLPALVVTLPTEGEILPTTQPTFAWQWPGGWGVNSDAFVFNNDYSFFQYDSLPEAQHAWFMATPLTVGENLHLQLRYTTNHLNPLFLATTPLNTNSSHQPISGWISASGLSASEDVNFSVNLPVAVGGHTNLLYYSFEDNDIFATDYSPNGNNVATISGFGGGSAYTTNVQTIGSYAAYFSNNGGSGASWLNPPTNLLATLARTFSISLWVNTTQATGNDTDDGLYGDAGLVSAFNGPGNNWVIPMAITGHKLAFATGGSSQSTLHSAADINTGSYVHLVVTRNQSTGEKKIYVNGVLDATGTGSTDLLNDPTEFNIGYNNGVGFDGRMDEIQIYSGVLSDSEVLQLYDNPGTAIPDLAGSGSDFNQALNTTGLTWTTSGTASWFVETTNTHDNVSAAQSGSVTNSQTSSLSTTVTGPGTLTFYWASLDGCNNFDYEFDIDGNFQTDIYCSTPWTQAGPFSISGGQHTLTWKVSSYGDNDPTQAGFLDQVSYVLDLTPIITLNPFNQTNYPGYKVALIAAATNSSSITWQWFKVGSASPIPNATNLMFIPTNSGTAGVAGSYYAVASAPAGTAITTTASVSFVSAPLPPDWAHALKSPFSPVDGSVFNKDYYLGCAADAAGDIYAAAQYFSNMNIVTNGNNANVLTAPGSTGAALVKHSANGNALWAVGLTNNQSGYSYGLTVAAAPGNGAYLASQMGGTNWLGTNKFVETAGGSILLSRFDANGSNVWSKFIGGTNFVYTSYNMLVSDAAGNVTLAGYMSGTVNFGGTNLSSPAGGGFIVQYDTNGAVRWAQSVPESVEGLACDSSRLYVSLPTSSDSGVTNVSIGSLSNATDRAWAVACLNASNGQPLWLRGVGHQYGANSAGLNIDGPLISVSGSNVFLTANTFGSSVVFGNLSVPLPGGRGQYFARYDTNGNPQAATVFGSPTTMLWASAANASGVYVSGDFDSYSQFGNLVIAAPLFTTNELDFTIGNFTYTYFTQPLVAKFDFNGNPLWARNGVSSAFANFRGIATTSDGVWASGFLKVKDISSPAQFGTNYVSSDLYVPGVGPSAIIFTQAGMIAKIGEAAVASPVTLLNPQNNGTTFQFQFLSQSGFTHAVQYRTNLVVGSWLTYSNVTGDGALKTIPIPLSVFNPAKQGFVHVSTQ